MSKLLIYAIDLYEKDAVGNHCIAIAKIANYYNIDVSLYAVNFSANTYINSYSMLLSEVQPEDILFFSYSIYDQNLEELLMLPNRKICYFHGVTPSKFLRKHDPITAELCKNSVNQFTSLKKFDFLYSNSIFSASKILKLFPSKKINILPPFVSSFFYRKRSYKKFPFSNGRINILCLGRIAPHKSIEDSIELARILKSKKINFFLNIVGSFELNEYYDFINKLIDNYQLRANIHLHGIVEESQKRQLMNKSDVLLSTSKHEGYGLTIPEGMASNLIIIARKNSIPIDNIEDYIFSFNSVNEIFDFLISVDVKMFSKIITKQNIILDEIIKKASKKKYFDLFRAVGFVKK
jgi:glycosyltransferase involved in cell wall biosynthesis